jgi:hypothetical protein
VRTDRHALAQLELGDRLAGLGHLRLLAGDRGQVADAPVDQLGVAGRSPDTHVDDDLGQPGTCMTLRSRSSLQRGMISSR